MAIPKKGSRIVNVEGEFFRWYIRKKPTYEQGLSHTLMTIALQKEGCETPNVLYVSLKVSRPDNWLKKHQTGITPSFICKVISVAINDGWNPTAGGSAYEFEFEAISETIN